MFHEQKERERQVNMAIRNYMKLTGCNYKVAANFIESSLKEKLMRTYEVNVTFESEDMKATHYLSEEFVRFKVVTDHGDEKTVLQEILNYLTIRFPASTIRSIELRNLENY